MVTDVTRTPKSRDDNGGIGIILVRMTIPQARIVKQGGQLFAPPPAPPARPGQLKAQLREVVAVAFGLWPLTAVVMLMVALLFMTSVWSSP